MEIVGVWNGIACTSTGWLDMRREITFFTLAPVKEKVVNWADGDGQLVLSKSVCMRHIRTRAVHVDGLTVSLVQTFLHVTTCTIANVSWLHVHAYKYYTI